MLRFIRSTLPTALGLAALTLAGASRPAEAQFGRRLKDAVKRTAEDKVIQKTVAQEDRALDGALTGSQTAGATDSAAPAAT